MKTIDLDRLKAIVTRLLDEAVEANGSPDFVLQEDLYWTLSIEQRFDMSRVPTPDLVGNLHDDWDLTVSIPDGPEKMSAYSLTEVAPLLDYIGHKLVAE